MSGNRRHNASRWTAAALAAAFLLLAAGSALAFRCPDSDRACLRQAVEGHAVRTFAYWQNRMGGGIPERFERAPRELIEYLTLDNRLNGFPQTPEPVDLSPGFSGDLKAALEELPVPVRTLMTPKLAGLFVVRNLGGTGYTEAVLNERGEPVAGFIVLDEAVLSRSANAWFTWKENTPFRPDPRLRIAAVIEPAGGDNRRNAIQFILLHEIGHLLSIGERFHPFWFDGAAAVRKRGEYPFLDLSWTVSPDGKEFASRCEAAFPERGDVVFYGTPKLTASAMVEVYRHLARTNFVTLYGATNPYDDFAEAFATYVHSVLLGKPYEIRIMEGDSVRSVFRLCWDGERCEGKQRILSEWLHRAEQPEAAGGPASVRRPAGNR